MKKKGLATDETVFLTIYIGLYAIVAKQILYGKILEINTISHVLVVVALIVTSINNYKNKKYTHTFVFGSASILIVFSVIKKLNWI